MSENDLNEIFASPAGLSPVVRLDGQTLYGSEKLNESFIKALTKCGRTKGSINTLHALVLKKKIIPCFQTKGWSGLIAWKIFAPRHETGVVGFYDPTRTKRIYILISNNANIFSFVSNNFMGILTIHESMHMLADQKTSVFFNMLRNELIAYYTEFFKMVFRINNIDAGKMNKILKFLFMDIERKSASMTMGTINKYGKVLEKELSGITLMKPDEFQRTVDDLVAITKVYLVSTERFITARENFRHIIGPLYLAYKRVFNITNYTTMCVQELIFPSEVIAMISEDMRYGRKALAGISKL